MRWEFQFGFTSIPFQSRTSRPLTHTHTHSLSLSHSLTHSINQSINQSFNQSFNQSINQSINQSFNQSFNQSINQSIIQSITLTHPPAPPIIDFALPKQRGPPRHPRHPRGPVVRNGQMLGFLTLAAWNFYLTAVGFFALWFPGYQWAFVASMTYQVWGSFHSRWSSPFDPLASVACLEIICIMHHNA